MALSGEGRPEGPAGTPDAPSTEAAAIIALEDAHGTGVTPKRPVAIVRGEGALLWDPSGKEYIDLGANYGVCNVGHCHPRVVEAVRAQAGRLLYVSPTLYNDARARLQARLAALAPPGLDRVLLTNSGTESVESAIKFARRHTGRGGIVAAMRGFHGRTMGALSITWNKKYREGFEPLLPGCAFVPYGDLEALKAAVGAGTAAVVLEPVQGEGGVFPAPEGYLRGAREVCTDAGALLVADEVQTGLGRTGAMFGVDHWGVVPDIMTLAKSLGSGLPIGAMVATAEVCDLPPGSHGSTFAGSPICCAAALATLDVIVDEGLPARAAALGERAMASLGGLEGTSAAVREVRGMGLMIGIELKEKAAPHLNRILEMGAVALPAGTTVVRLLPPLTITERQLDRGLDIVKEALSGG